MREKFEGESREGVYKCMKSGREEGVINNDLKCEKFN